MAEIYVSVDIEASGPLPPTYSMLSLGACLVDDPDQGFYAELKPISTAAVPEAMAIVGRTMDDFAIRGREPADAMTAFCDWLAVIGHDADLVFVGFNATFDWAFVNWYFLEYVGRNPFGIGGLDIKSFYMGQAGVCWADTRSSRLPPYLQEKDPDEHHALADAARQARLFRKLLRVR